MNETVDEMVDETESRAAGRAAVEAVGRSAAEAPGRRAGAEASGRAAVETVDRAVVEVAGRTAGGAYDVVVVGGGAGGLSAALVLARARCTVAVVDSGSPRNAPAAQVRGFLTRDGMSPGALLETGRREVAGYGVRLLDARVDRIERAEEGVRGGEGQAHGLEGAGAGAGPGPAAGPGVATPRFLVRLADGGPVLVARRVLLATGLRDELPEIPGVAERWGKEVLHCPYCHGHEVRDRPLGVLGAGAGAVGQALLLREWSKDVVLFAHTLEVGEEERERLAARGVRVVDGAVGRLAVDGGRLRGVELADGRAVPRDAVFVPPRAVPRDALLSGLGCVRDDDGWVVVDASGRTSVPGVWAVGNVADRRAQVVTAAGAGSAAAIALHHDLVEEAVARAVAERRGRAEDSV